MKANSASSPRAAARKNGKAGARTAGKPEESPRGWQIRIILVPVDFSEGSKAAYELALELAGQYNARVHLLHVVEQSTSPDFESFPLARNRDSLITQVKKELTGFAQAGRGSIVPVYPEVRLGSPWEQIVEAARDDSVDLIVMPTRGQTGLKRLLIGSVAERVVRHAPCPVLALRNKQPAAPAARPSTQEER